ncbi:rCG43918 [Rattus norvegicus]|uniref:RCG43918 n=1 Tax=Rattus norvegicus TaxID=10116 RepID=A6J7Q7_RAT|nr:rCG43918 [Rattus norvegicus]
MMTSFHSPKILKQNWQSFLSISSLYLARFMDQQKM